MHDRCNKRVAAGVEGSESLQRMHLLMSRISQFMLLLYQKVEGVRVKDRASAALPRSCLERCALRFLDPGCPDSIRFVHLATIAQFSQLDPKVYVSHLSDLKCW